MQQTLSAEFQKRFGRAPVAVTRAPGRIEFIGNHTDYNGGTVLGAAIDRAVWVAIAPRGDGRRRFVSADREDAVDLGVAELSRQVGGKSWANYPLGVLTALEALGRQVPAGFDYLAMTDVPSGAGLSSSAAIELASALAFFELTGEQPDRETVVKIGRHAENHFVGVPCGILDQGVSGFGRAEHLVFIDCRGPSFDTVPLPGGVQFWIFNTHTKHALVDGLYAARHAECMAAAKVLGVALLADATPEQVEAHRAALGETSYKRAKHVVEEIARVTGCVAALEKRDLGRVGELLTASHRSSQRLFENSTAELDFLVDTLIAENGVQGARLTGGGFGGAVMAMTSGAFDARAAERVRAAYARKFHVEPEVLACRTADGAKTMWRA
ncbi:galactokinase [Horticoccus luteus]|uniref:Galactokinase n=1 Tax=Horticoccus luteus TaxID=2862869 RepID=A0A8F9TX49_9BACT|nr:galactokinase [Horticoccus luteus]QYM79368.1 galactokinase [Horticoccus luteus]